MVGVGRFAPSTTGPAHPGTLLAALLCWCDARRRGMRLVLRLEDLDPERCKPGFAEALRDQLIWFGLSFDSVAVQSDASVRHGAALDALADAGLLYACTCTRAQLKGGVRAPDGGFVYPNTCRGTRALGRHEWPAAPHALRVRLPDGVVVPTDVGGLDLSQAPASAMGDPVVRRRDGSVAYQLAVVVDDAASGVTHVVRGRDIAASTATQVALMQLLELSVPSYRHHFLLCEPRGDKLAKLHGSVGVEVLRQTMTAADLCGFLAHVAGLRATPAPCVPQDVLSGFSWERVARADQVVEWDADGRRLVWRGPAYERLSS